MSWIFALQGLAGAALDLDGNGVCDVWEHKFDAGNLVADAASKAADEDGDGQSNYAESEAGTDPRDASSVHRVGEILRVGAAVELSQESEKGKCYQVFVSESGLDGPWIEAGPAKIATGDTIDLDLGSQSDDVNFYRVEAKDADSDGDGVSDWAEEQLEGFDPADDDSFGEGTANHDLAVASALMNAIAADEFSVSTLVAEGFEKEEIAAKFELSRSGDSTHPATVFLTTSGNPDSSKGSAGEGDYVLKDAGGVPLGGRVVIPAGVSSVEIFCHPVKDALVEVPETLTCGISGGSSEAAVRICDATNVLANSRLFVAQLAPENGALTAASGLSTLLLQGDNEIGSVNLNFYGLTSPQTAVLIQIRNPENGPQVESLPRGQVEGHQWLIEAAQFLATDQAMLDALLAGKLYVNVHSMNYPSGEIRGDFLRSTGSTDLSVPPDPPEVETLAGDELDRDIVRFLTQATFGPTPELVEELRDLVVNTHGGDRIAAYGAWIDAQMAVPSPDMEPGLHAADAQVRYLRSIVGSPDYSASYNPGDLNRQPVWWLHARHAPDHLRQRMAFALSEIFVVSDKEPVIKYRHYGHAHYYDMLKNGAFGSYRDLLEGVATHPIMGQYLSHLRNGKAILDTGGNVIVSPDENFAREIMQLFSIGLVLLHEDGSLKLNAQGLPEPTYLQDDISEMARVFTGWSFSKDIVPEGSDIVVDNTNFNLKDGPRYDQAQWSNRMKCFAAYHDDGAKSMPVLGLDLAAGLGGEGDLDGALDHLAAHQSTAPFICRRLIQRLVTSNPSAGYLYRMTQVWKSSDGDLGAVCKAILLDYEARSPLAAEAVTFGKKKEPVIQALGLMRAMGSESRLPLEDLDPSDTSIADLSAYAYSPSKLALFPAELAKFPAGTKQVRIRFTDESLGQTPMSAPTVFNWFLPNFTVPGPLADAGMRAPEFQIANEITVIQHVNFLYNHCFYTNGTGAASLPNQHAVDGNGDPHPDYNPYGYAAGWDDIASDFSPSSPLSAPYMAIMDSNGDGGISSADASFDDPASIAAGCAALVDHFDLLLCAGRFQDEYGTGWSAGVVRPGNPRDVIIDTMARNSDFRDDNDNAADQERVWRDRIRLAAYLVSTSPFGMVQK